MFGYIKKFPDRPGYSEDITLDIKGGNMCVRWYLYDEYYPGFEDHEFIIENIPEVVFQQVFSLKTEYAILRFLKQFFKESISAERFIQLLESKNIPYIVKPDDEWFPG